MKPRIVSGISNWDGAPIVIGETKEGSHPAESFSISMAHDPSGKRVVLLDGADMRGTIYAIYQFSQEFLGVDPMYYWTDDEPVRRSSAVLAAEIGACGEAEPRWDAVWQKAVADEALVRS